MTITFASGSRISTSKKESELSTLASSLVDKPTSQAIFVAIDHSETEQSIVGAVWLNPINEDSKLLLVAVSENFRLKGIGSALIDMLFDVDVNPENIIAKKQSEGSEIFLKNTGFVESDDGIFIHESVKKGKKRKIGDTGDYIPGSAKEKRRIKKSAIDKPLEGFERLEKATSLSSLLGKKTLIDLGMSFVEIHEENDELTKVPSFYWPNALNFARSCDHWNTEGSWSNVRIGVKKFGKKISQENVDRFSEIAESIAKAVGLSMNALSEVSSKLTNIRETAMVDSILEKDHNKLDISQKLKEEFSKLGGDEAKAAIKTAIDQSESLKTGTVASWTDSSLLQAFNTAAHRFDKYLNELLSDKDSLDIGQLLSVFSNFRMVRLEDEAKRLAGDFQIDKVLKGMTNRQKVLEFIRKGGRDITDIVDENDLKEQFKIRGIQWGGYVSDKRRVDLLLRAAASIRDLSDAIGVEDGDLFGGKLAIGFGARGKGRASAHYEPGQHVINMTRDSGDGSLAHEIFHSIDFMGKGSVVDSPYSFDNPHCPAELKEAFQRLKDALTKPVSLEAFVERRRAEAEDAKKLGGEYLKIYRDRVQEIKDAFQAETKKNEELLKASTDENEKKKIADEMNRLRVNYNFALTRVDKNRLIANHYNSLSRKLLMDADNAYNQDYWKKNGHPPSKFLDDAQAIEDGGGKSDYWTTTHEMAARAFETYIAEKMEESGLENNYLVDKKASLNESLKSSAFPMGAERDVIIEAFDNLFAVIKKVNYLATEVAVAKKKVKE